MECSRAGMAAPLGRYHAPADARYKRDWISIPSAESAPTATARPRPPTPKRAACASPRSNARSLTRDCAARTHNEATRVECTKMHARSTNSPTHTPRSRFAAHRRNQLILRSAFVESGEDGILSVAWLIESNSSVETRVATPASSACAKAKHQLSSNEATRLPMSTPMATAAATSFRRTVSAANPPAYKPAAIFCHAAGLANSSPRACMPTFTSSYPAVENACQSVMVSVNDAP
mmetsp:Transcript_39833/g.84927  ORF Transcript_39833/g.84927 Transcript_39833/m.84927 type:complete len:234 (-) Transcript_39833:119-820(-)